MKLPNEHLSKKNISITRKKIIGANDALFLALFWLKKRGKNQKSLHIMFCLVRPCLFYFVSILNLLQSNFAHRSGLIYYFSVLPCHPCHFSPFLYLFLLSIFPLLITIKKLKLTRLGDYRVRVLLDFSLLSLSSAFFLLLLFTM